MLVQDAPRVAKMPAGQWVMKMTWHDLLFAHWPMACDDLRPLVPRGLKLDKYDGRAWIGVVPFRMTGIRMRGLPGFPGATAFTELNVRTYVTDANGENPGVWFFTLDATSRLAIAVARRWYHLNYQPARMTCRLTPDGGIDYRSQRLTHEAAFAATYRPVGDAGFPRWGSFEHFLTERYCLYAQDASHRLYRADVHHAPWQLHKAEADITVNTTLDPLGLTLPTVTPHLLYAKRCEALAWTPKRIT
ncbi:MAG: DUF2071 domain-containing protein [Phycisphaera sp.]|nr:DUF2071 domain-containing protein [Phycisphaera sp.]